LIDPTNRSHLTCESKCRTHVCEPKSRTHVCESECRTYVCESKCRSTYICIRIQKIHSAHVSLVNGLDALAFNSYVCVCVCVCVYVVVRG